MQFLPDLGHSREITNEDILSQPTEAVSTKEELDAGGYSLEPIQCS